MSRANMTDRMRAVYSACAEETQGRLDEYFWQRLLNPSARDQHSYDFSRDEIRTFDQLLEERPSIGDAITSQVRTKAELPTTEAERVLVMAMDAVKYSRGSHDIDSSLALEMGLDIVGADRLRELRRGHPDISEKALLELTPEARSSREAEARVFEVCDGPLVIETMTNRWVRAEVCAEIADTLGCGCTGPDHPVGKRLVQTLRDCVNYFDTFARDSHRLKVQRRGLPPAWAALHGGPNETETRSAKDSYTWIHSFHPPRCLMENTPTEDRWNTLDDRIARKTGLSLRMSYRLATKGALTETQAQRYLDYEGTVFDRAMAGEAFSDLEAAHLEAGEVDAKKQLQDIRDTIMDSFDDSWAADYLMAEAYRRYSSKLPSFFTQIEMTKKRINLCGERDSRVALLSGELPYRAKWDKSFVTISDAWRMFHWCPPPETQSGVEDLDRMATRGLRRAAEIEASRCETGESGLTGAGVASLRLVSLGETFLERDREAEAALDVSVLRDMSSGSHSHM